MTDPGPAIGSARRRREDPALLTGRGAYIQDLRSGDNRLLHVVFVRSPLASAQIQMVHTAAAAASTGVVRVVTGADLHELNSLPLPGAPFLPGFPAAPAHPVLARDRVHFVGEPVAAIVAESVALAEDARDLVEVDYDPLPAVASLEDALRADAPAVHDDFPGNILATNRRVAGEPDAVFANADHVVHVSLRHGRVASVAMEPRGTIAEYQAESARLTVWMSTQAPFLARHDLAQTLGIKDERLRVIAPDVGGGFGAKVGAHPEDAVVAYLTMQLGKPISWVATRSEDMSATFHGRDILTEVDLATNADGVLLALRVKAWSNVGAYALWHGPLPVQRLLNFTTGCYRIEHLDATVSSVLTNTQPIGPYRGAGRPEAAHAIERAIDAVAAELRMDPVELRRRNFIPPEAFPYTNAGGATYDSGAYERALDLALQHADYATVRAEQTARRARGELVGIGVATYTEQAGGGFETGDVTLDADGHVIAATGASAFGQGQHTTFSQIVAAELGVDPDDVKIVSGDTEAVQTGMGSFGSRSVILGGNALAQAAGVVRKRALHTASGLLEVAPDDLELARGKVQVRGAPDRAVDLARVIQASGATELRESVRFVSADGDTFPFGAVLASVSIDPESARIRLERLFLVDDCGRAINPLLVDGQLVGGAAQGIGEALLEQVVYTQDGQLATGSLLDYAIPRADSVPELLLDRTETLSPRNPLGVKGVGEAGTVGTPAAIANAVLDALRPLGIHDVELPITSEQVWRILQG